MRVLPKILILLVFLSGPAGLIWGSGSPQLLKSFETKGSPVSKRKGRLPAESPRELDPALELLLNGDLTRQSEEERWRVVHEKEPDSALHYARYLQETDSLPKDFEEIVDRIAPENAWFDLWKISQVSADICRQLRLSPGKEPDEAESVSRYRVLDEAAMRELLEIFHEAALKPELTDYFREIEEILQADLSVPTTYPEQISYLTKVLQPYAISNRSGILIQDFVGPACQFLITQDDRAGFVRFEESVVQLAPKLLENTATAAGGVIFQNWLERTAPQLRHTARHFDLSGLTEKYERLNQKLADYRTSQRDTRVAKGRSEADLFERHSSLLMALTAPVYTPAKSPHLTPEDLRPSCRAEKALFSRFFTGSAFLLFTGLALACWVKKLLIRSKIPPKIRRRIEAIQAPTLSKMLLWGVVVPFFFFLLVRYLTPFGQLDLSYLATATRDHIYHALPFLAGVLLIGASIVLAGRRLAIPAYRFTLSDALLLGLPLVAYLAHGAFFFLGQASFVLLLIRACLGVSLCWLGFLAMQNQWRKSLRGAVMNGLAIPAFFLAAGLFGLWTWILTWEEKEWLDRDHLGKPVAHYSSRFEAKMVRQHLAELEELLP